MLDRFVSFCADGNSRGRDVGIFFNPCDSSYLNIVLVIRNFGASTGDLENKEEACGFGFTYER